MPYVKERMAKKLIRLIGIGFFDEFVVFSLGMSTLDYYCMQLKCFLNAYLKR